MILLGNISPKMAYPTLPETNSQKAPEVVDGWKTMTVFLLGSFWPIFKGCSAVRFGEFRPFLENTYIDPQLLILVTL